MEREATDIMTNQSRSSAMGVDQCQSPNNKIQNLTFFSLFMPSSAFYFLSLSRCAGYSIFHHRNRARSAKKNAVGKIHGALYHTNIKSSGGLHLLVNRKVIRNKEQHYPHAPFLIIFIDVLIIYHYIKKT